MSELNKTLATASAHIRKESMNGYGRFWDAYTIVGNVLYDLIGQGAQDPPGDVSECASKRISLTAGLLQSTIIVEQAITCGLYWAASALLRQHMEALARVIHIRNGQLGTEARPPHLAVLPFRLARNYGRLCELVHVSNGELLGDFTGSIISDMVATPLPSYKAEWANDLLAVHTSHMITLAYEIHYLHVEIYPGMDIINVNSRLYDVAKILEELGHWKDLSQSSDG